MILFIIRLEFHHSRQDETNCIEMKKEEEEIQERKKHSTSMIEEKLIEEKHGPQ